MARVTDALLNGRAQNFGGNPMLNLQLGGQFGYGQELREWVSNQNHVRRNSICLLLESPRFFRYMNNPEVWTGTLKSLVELHARSFEGLNKGLTVETGETPVGGAGEMQEEYTDVKRARSQVTFTFDEKYGLPVAKFFEAWITYGLMDPSSKFANIGTMAGARPTDMLADQYSATMIFIEPDPTHQRVIQAWLGTNMWPKGTGEITAKRDLASAGELVSRNIEFTGIYQTGLGVDVLAQTLLDQINIINANPGMQQAFIDGIAPDVAAQNFGYENRAETLGANSVRT